MPAHVCRSSTMDKPSSKAIGIWNRYKKCRFGVGSWQFVLCAFSLVLHCQTLMICVRSCVFIVHGWLRPKTAAPNPRLFHSNILQALVCVL